MSSHSLRSEENKKVLPFFYPPSLIVKQFTAMLEFRKATGWPGVSKWLAELPKVAKVAAGAQGLGCFGYPIHPVYEVTAACNLLCKHCHARGGKPWPDELNTEQAKLVIKSLSEVPEFRMLVFTGGEPLVRKDIFELTSYATELGFSVVMATNATLINKKIARKLKENGVLGIAASIDSVNPKQHDEYRGVPNAFKLAIQGIKNAAEEGLYIQINITLSKRNLSQLEDLLKLADKLNSDAVLLYQLIPVGRGSELMKETLTAKEFLSVIKRLKKIQGEIKTVVAPVGLPEYYAYLYGTSNRIFPESLNGSYHGCIAGRGMFYIKPNGDVWPCAFIPVSAGNLLKQSALEIWRKSYVFNVLRDRNNLKGYCHECKYRDVCGGCRARALAYTGDLLASDPECPLVKATKKYA